MRTPRVDPGTRRTRWSSLVRPRGTGPSRRPGRAHTATRSRASSSTGTAATRSSALLTDNLSDPQAGLPPRGPTSPRFDDEPVASPLAGGEGVGDHDPPTPLRQFPFNPHLSSARLRILAVEEPPRRRDNR